MVVVQVDLMVLILGRTVVLEEEQLKLVVLLTQLPEDQEILLL